MSIQAVQWAFSLELPPTSKYVLVAVADHADETGRCWPSPSHIVAKTGLSERSVRYALRGLKAAKIIIEGASRGRSLDLRLSLETTEVTDEMRDVIQAESLVRSAKNEASGEGETGTTCRKPAPRAATKPAPRAANRHHVPHNRHHVPDYRTIKNHQESSLPPKPPSDAPVVRVVKDERDMTFRSADGSETIRIPDFVPLDAWTGYLEMRDRKKAPRTAYALRKIIGELERFHVAGHDVRGILDTSTMNGWKGVFEPKGQAAARPAFAKPKDPLSHQAERMREKMAGWRS